MAYTIDTKLETVQDEEDFCQYIVDEELDYNAESGFDGNASLDDEQKAGLNRLAQEASDIAQKEDSTLEQMILLTKCIRTQRVLR